ncbi:MAG: hypothetical protein Q7T57_05610 [Dehalococcoidales bacterium]|nr:hypothetical protein [Dehalococcoidales bacterium]
MAIEIFNVEWTKPLPFDEALTQAASHEGGIYAMYIQIGHIYKPHYIGMRK